MEVIAKLNYLRIAPRKIRLLVDVVRGMDVVLAIRQLEFRRKKGALPLIKLLKSAISNAEHNFKLKKENLYIKKITADGGPVIKRWRSRAFGRAAPILKRSTHITVVLDERVAAAKIKKKEAKAPSPEKKEEIKIVSPDEIKKSGRKKTGGEKGGEREGKSSDFVKKIFNRKAV